ncbi:hypothetical protein V7S43_014260 [Phytophthora oleae]|uniref:Uncharacterized protein n=1 Tax=Phytophthora oleae TaxID=2107226 RepID=A0ABD3F249_9STRA
MWFAEGKPAENVVTGIDLSYANVTMLLEKRWRAPSRLRPPRSSLVQRRKNENEE